MWHTISIFSIQTLSTHTWTSMTQHSTFNTHKTQARACRTAPLLTACRNEFFNTMLWYIITRVRVCMLSSCILYFATNNQIKWTELASWGTPYPSCADRFVTDLVLGRACLSNVKVVFWHVSERVNLQVPVSGCKLVTWHVARYDLYL